MSTTSTRPSGPPRPPARPGVTGVRHLLAALIAALAVIGGVQVGFAPTASAGQLGLVVEVQGAAKIVVVEGSIEDGPTECDFTGVVDQREWNTCGRMRNQEVLSASVWLRPLPADGWDFTGWAVGCDDVRHWKGRLYDCKVSSGAFSSDERVVKAFFHDTVMPEVLSGAQRYSTTKDRTVAYDFTVNKGRTECHFPETGWTPCTSGVEHTWPSSGEFQTGIRAVDASGRTSPHRVFITRIIDTQIDSGPSPVSGSRSADFTVSAPGATELVCSVDGGADHVCGSPGVPFTVQVATDGAHELVVHGRDGAWRDHTVARHRWTVDTTGPDATVGAVTVTGRTAVVAFGVPDASSFTCRLSGPFDDTGWRECRSPTTFTDLPDGHHVLEVRAHDDLGNPGAVARREFDVVAPTVPTDPKPTDPGPKPPVPPVPTQPAPLPVRSTTATVVRVVDADTLVVRVGPTTLTVDVAGLTAPAAPRCQTRRGLASLQRLARVGATVRLDPTPASRTTRVSPWSVSAAGRDVGALQLRAGHARLARAEAPTASRAAYTAAQRSARAAHRGLWGRC